MRAIFHDTFTMHRWSRSWLAHLRITVELHIENPDVRMGLYLLGPLTHSFCTVPQNLYSVSETQSTLRTDECW